MARTKLSREARTAMSAKISKLAKEGYGNPKQRVAIAFSEYRKGGLRRLKQSHGRRKGTTHRRAA